MASEVRRFTCLTCSDFSKERAASEDSREKTLNSKRIHRLPNKSGTTQVRGQTSLTNRKFPDGSCVYSSRDNASPGRFNKGTQPHVTTEVRVYSLRWWISSTHDEKLRPRGKQQARITFIPLLLASYLFLWGFPSSLSCSLTVFFQNLKSGRRRGTSSDSRTGRRAEGNGGVTAFSRLLFLPEIPSMPGRETPCPLNGVTGLPWLRGTPWNQRHRRAQRKAHLFWKNIIRTRARHEPHQGRCSPALASLSVHLRAHSPSTAHGESAQLECSCVFRRDDGGLWEGKLKYPMREKRRRANPMSIIHKRPRLSGLNVMFNVVDACDARSDNARREIPGDCSCNSRNWRHAIN
ncbi:hypothetical protein G5I_12120 [Acromyrmex echinatior]|uniref:Uncharacterized protein n=1 Tax=Acromyrmex echinatior TaxID=103372 RepID=F4X1J0_ACREC|nr:hypothetical protein G5I_12120 [Acromyrmex echinatior]